MDLSDSVKQFIQTINYMAATAKDGYEFISRLAGIANDLFLNDTVSKTKIDKFLDELQDERFGMTTTDEITILNEIQDYFENFIETPYLSNLSSGGSGNDISDDPNWQEYLNARDDSGYGRYSDNADDTLDVDGDDFDDDAYDDYYNRVMSYNVKKDKKKNNTSNYSSGYGAYGYDVEPRDYYVIGYGSLINERSRARTIDTIDSAYVKVNGYSRIFNVGAGNGTVLNVAPNENAWINAVLMKVDWKDMQDLYWREFQYEEHTVPIEDISFPYGGKKMDIEHPPIIFVSTANVQQDPKFDYVKACIYGSAQVSNKFAKDFIKTTRTYDGTPLGRYLIDKYGAGIFKEFKEADSKY